MLIKLKRGSTDEDISSVRKFLKSFENLDLKTEVEEGVTHKVICVIGMFNGRYAEVMDQIQAMDEVDDVVKVSKPYKLAGRLEHRENTVVRVGDNVEIGGEQVQLIAGPCAVESFDRLNAIAEAVKKAGATILRGGAFKPRTSPYSFQGLGVDGLKILQDVGTQHEMPVVTEVMTINQVSDVEKYADMLQVGARNMQNFDLLKEVGMTGKPVLLKRGMSAKVEDLLMSAEYILSEGNKEVVLCERGIRTFEDSTRNTFDLSAVPNIKHESYLPVAVDPSHATGRPELIPSMALAGVAAGADCIHIEVHNEPEKALSDGAQSLRPDQYGELVERMRKIAKAIGRFIK